MYTQNELQEAVDTLDSEGFGVIERHMHAAMQCYIDQLIDSSDTEDEKLKGRIQAIKNDFFTLKDQFKKMFSDEVKRKAEIEAAAKLNPGNGTN